MTKSRYDRFNSRYIERFALKVDKDWSNREVRLHILEKFLDDSIYDNLAPYHLEYANGSANNSYTPLAQRRPSVIYSMCDVIVNESTTMLFGDEHFPIVRCEHENTTEFLATITRESNLRCAMLEAARKGSIGSVGFLVKVLEGKLYYEILSAKHLVPYFDKMNPEKLVRLCEYCKYDGASLASMGYTIPEDDKNTIYCLDREWTDTQEIAYLPYKVTDRDTLKTFQRQIDPELTVSHNLGFVPVVWIKNLPESSKIDGRATFEKILDISIEINYQLSQLGRGLKYNSDPTLVVKNPQNLQDQQLIKGIGMLTLDESGDAYMLEMKNAATKSVIDFTDKLRQYALEVLRGNRANPEKLSAVTSGKALQMLNAAMISLVEDLRLTYGNSGLMKIYSMILDFKRGNIELDYDAPEPELSYNCMSHASLDWPDWYPPTPQDTLQKSQTLQTYKSSGIMSLETAVKSIADDYNILDIDAELEQIEKNQKADYDNSNLENKGKPSQEKNEKK